MDMPAEHVRNVAAERKSAQEGFIRRRSPKSNHENLVKKEVKEISKENDL